ncbi:hypothetical protein KJ636_04870 [Patescibacteria group bacterium]|nr:hypothetical protein [Patescibacteria group bacterium]MBU4481812.1 hypothetical protein [Patescibacteria group bacterium]
MFNPDALKIEKKPEIPEIKEKGSVFNPDELIAGLAKNPKNKEKVIDLFYGTPERKGWLEEEEPTARRTLNEILESGKKLPKGIKEILILKEIELIAGIKRINSRGDIEKIDKVYPDIDANKIAKDLKMSRNELYPVINILIRPTDIQKRVLKMLYDTEEGKKISISGIIKSLDTTTGSMPSLEVLRYIGLVELNEKKETTVDEKNKEQLRIIHPDIEKWSVKPVKKEVTEEKKRAKKGERITQAIQIIAENIKKTGINMEKISDKDIEKLIKDLSRPDFKLGGIDISVNYTHHLKQILLKILERGKLIPEIKNYMSKNT